MKARQTETKGVFRASYKGAELYLIYKKSLRLEWLHKRTKLYFSPLNIDYCGATYEHVEEWRRNGASVFFYLSDLIEFLRLKEAETEKEATHNVIRISRESLDAFKAKAAAWRNE